MKLSHKLKEQPTPVPWSKTHCSSIGLVTNPGNLLFYQADTFIASHGDTIHKNGSAIFKRSSDDQVCTLL
jgi:hypothetical protein